MNVGDWVELTTGHVDTNGHYITQGTLAQISVDYRSMPPTYEVALHRNGAMTYINCVHEEHLKKVESVAGVPQIKEKRTPSSVAEQIAYQAGEFYPVLENVQLKMHEVSQEMLHSIVDEWGYEIVSELAEDSTKPLSFHLGEDFADFSKAINHLFEAQMILDKLRNE